VTKNGLKHRTGIHVMFLRLNLKEKEKKEKEKKENT
jgi:hypothetical protein